MNATTEAGVMLAGEQLEDARDVTDWAIRIDAEHMAMHFPDSIEFGPLLDLAKLAQLGGYLMEPGYPRPLYRPLGDDDVATLLQAAEQVIEDARGSDCEGFYAPRIATARRLIAALEEAGR